MSDDEIRVIVDDVAPASADSASLQARPSFEEAIRRTLGNSVSLTISGITAQLAESKKGSFLFFHESKKGSFLFFHALTWI